MKAIICTSFAIILFLSCQSPLKNYYSDKYANRNRLVVSFFSNGEEIDHKTKDEFDKMINDFNSKKCKIGYETEVLHKEGEKDYYFPSGQSTPKCLEKFVAKAKALLKNKELVLLKEYTN